MADFLSRLVTKICHVLTTVDEPRRSAGRTFKVAHQNFLTNRTMDDEDAPGLKALLTFKLHDDKPLFFILFLLLPAGPGVKKNVRDIHGLALAIVLERLNSHGANSKKYHDKTELPEVDQSDNATSSITDFFSFLYFKRGVSAKGSKAESINVQLQCGCQEFEATSKDPEGHSVDDLIKEFHSCLSAKVSKTFDISLMGASSKSCEYLQELGIDDSMANNPMPAAHSTYA
ncbi:hypothetical protein Tco_0886207 [Tanacetum coccineum]